MPRNYDEMRQAEDRSFVINGETFTLKRVKPDVLNNIVALAKELPDEAPYSELYEFFQKQLLQLVDFSNGDMARWEKARDDLANPITYGEMQDLSRWATEVVTGLPSMPPTPSSPGARTSGSSSRGR